MYGQRRPVVLAWMVRIAYMVPLAIVYLVVHLGRRAARWYLSARAQSWPATDASVTNTYEIDENESALSRNGWDGWNDDYFESNVYHPRYAIAIQYSYEVDGELYSGTYFLPDTHVSGSRASEAEHAWKDKKFVVRYNPSKPRQSAFLVQDGAPGKPHIPRLLTYRPYITDLSLK